MQRTKRLKTMLTIGIITGLAVLLLFSACDTGTGSGVMEVSITDAPVLADDVRGVYITVVGIEYHATEDGWVTMEDFEGPKTFNLLALTRGDSELLGEIVLPSGTYSQIRFMLGLSEDTSTSEVGSWIERGDDDDGAYTDGEDSPLFVPSGVQTGYKAQAGEPFVVPINGTVSVTADFDLRRAVVKLGGQDKYILKPVLRLIVDNQAGEISGNITGMADNGYVVYVYETGTYDVSETDEPDDEATRFSNAVTSSVVEQEKDPDYVLAYLAEGSYDIVVAQFIDGEFDAVVYVSSDSTEVEAGETETYDIDL